MRDDHLSDDHRPDDHRPANQWPDDFELARLAAAHADLQSASRAVAAQLHAIFRPGAPVAWRHKGRTCRGVVAEASGPEWGCRLPVRVIEGGAPLIVYVTPSAVLHASGVEDRA